MSNSSRPRGILLASFINTDNDEDILTEVQAIVDNLTLTNKFIFLLAQESDPSKKILTYNALTESGSPFNPRLYTIRVHRKKQTNTLYTINALNSALSLEHEGKTGKDLKLDWEKYTNSLLLSTNKKLAVHPVEVLKIFKIEDEPEEK
jgi:hypothetical protein